MFAAGEFGPQGKVYDGWETRRRREPGHDHAIVRLGVPGVVHGVVVDTVVLPRQLPARSLGRGGRAPTAIRRRAELAADELAAACRAQLAARRHARTSIRSRPASRWTHVRLSIYPDGGVARFRVHGEPVPDPAFLTGSIDLAALASGAADVNAAPTVRAEGDPTWR